MKDMCSIAKFSTELALDFTIPIEHPVDSLEQSLEEVLEEEDNEVPVRNKRQRIANSFGGDFIVYFVDDTPISIRKAYASLDADDCKEAVCSEMDLILSNRTYELFALPFGCKTYWLQVGV
jgi:hypothetical protein